MLDFAGLAFISHVLAPACDVHPSDFHAPKALANHRTHAPSAPRSPLLADLLVNMLCKRCICRMSAVRRVSTHVELRARSFFCRKFSRGLLLFALQRGAVAVSARESDLVHE
jgi:hypothetical protein